MRRGYVDTPQGQLHWRAHDAAATDIVLLHWGPGSSRMYEDVLAELAGLGVNGLAFDLPGFGASFKPEGWLSPIDVADCLGLGLERLTDRAVTIVGGHLSGECLLHWAIQSPGQVSGVVTDGLYAVEDAEFAALLAPYAGLTPRFDEDGAHETFLWRATMAVLTEWDPHFAAAPEAMATVYAAMSDYLLMGYPAILAWMEAEQSPPGLAILDLVRAVTQPVLVLSADEDPLACAFARTIAACRTPPRSHRFPGVHPLPRAGGAPAYAAVLADFVRQA